MNFLQKGLAGLESRLDKVLLDESERQQHHHHNLESSSPSPAPPPPPLSLTSPPAGQAAQKANGRMTMQERLAAAVAKADGGSRRSSGESLREKPETARPPEKEKENEKDGENGAVNGAGGAGEKREQEVVGEVRGDEEGEGEGEFAGVSREELVRLVRELKKATAAAAVAEEEKEKARVMVKRAPTPALAAGAGGSAAAAEKKLTEAQEKIALLLEEGEKLSRGELKLRNTIKELRIKTQEEERLTGEARKRAERSEKDAAEAKEKLKRAAEDAKRDKERLKGVAKLERELQNLKNEKEALLAAMQELKARVEEGNRRADEAESKVQTEALGAERKRSAELAVELARVRGEAAGMEEALTVEVADLKSKIARDTERARSVEQELKAEQAVMERKMEALRARAEEVSSGASGDAHAKLLRQVETLQTQYAIASENWQGIEGSMLGRIAGLEKERDELTKREADVRRKARDLSIKSKNLDMDLESANSRIKDLESDLAISQQTTVTLQARLKALETELTTLRSTFEHERQTWQRDLDTKLAEERQKWADQLQHHDSRPSSPLNLHLHTAPPSLPLRKSSGPLSTTESYFVGTRKPSRSPGGGDIYTPSPTAGTPTDHFSRRGFSTPPTTTAGAARMAPAPEEDDSDYFDNIPFSPRRGDMVSVSTVAAGPSVQLVERMSATVRRLESEMVAAREEVAAMARGRDEARAEVVELVREVEEKRACAERVRVLEAEVAKFRTREETALVMLGERTEQVEELRADVEDLKQMYRDLVSDFNK
ncbi:TATA element modulatory factor 1 TATA binding-domain-containing protein [Morchella snyderi]|nr:TATA element modulatory factor 1 TATA binding-domain-containing protein [Morchella snyderi]